MRCYLAFAVLTSLFFVAGCGGEPRGKLSGTVTFDNKPLPGGTVIFMTDDNSKTEHVPIQSDGKYSSDNIPLGKLRVAVLPPASGPVMPAGAKVTGAPADHPQAKLYSQANSAPPVNIPEALRDPATSNITVEVTGGEQPSFDIPLKGA